ncbi:hypothetical protein [Streptomyces pini]|uniref:Uncharacterized protein n=1 Tax=Streptomyces pini TaxID=1520580 RepID=A0A1I4JSF7_9ACTN|nr:hypothetical protein [Streptomyces pini]SFL69535.1 hypothetical protein SAMN05192584_12471 [Streptomyces pini]
MAQQTRVARARRWWRSTPSLIRRFSVVLLILGVVLAGTGLWLDRTNWWEGHGFFANLVSSLTSLCFGVPTALLVLSHLGETQAHARQTQRVKDYARNEIHEFQVALTKAFNVTDTTELAARVRTLSTGLHQFRQLAVIDGPTAARFFQTLNALLALGRGPTRSYRPSTNFGALSRDRWQWRRIETWHVRVETQWRVLSEEVRPKILECGLRWLPRSPAAEAEQAMRRLLDEDGRNPWRMPEHFTDPDAVKAMGHFLHDLRVLCSTAETLAAYYPSRPREPGRRRSS